jgi:glutathione S-transferase
MVRLYRANFSTNVERVALALAYKGIEVESRYISYDDRSEVLEVSGQPLVPVIVDTRERVTNVVFDSMQIIAYVESHVPSPPLYPSDEARYAEMMVFIDWFNRVWKIAPNRIEAELEAEEPDHMLIIRFGREMALALDGFEGLLSGRKYLFGNEFSAADCCVFPFLKYAVKREPADNDPFHLVLDEYQELTDDHMRLRSWIRRIDEMPRA